MNGALHGVVTPLLTPFLADGTIAQNLFDAHAAQCLSEGSHYLAPFGTTGEATSIGMAARQDALERLLTSQNVQPNQLMPGTGLNAVQDTAALTRHAVGLGVAAVLLLPPFYYKNADEDGLYRYVATLIETVADDRLRIVLYHIPKFTGTGFSPAITRRLALDYPGIVAGYKDSSGQWMNTAQILRAAPDLAVFPGSESFLPQALAAGGAGCISASCNVNVAAIRAVYDALKAGENDKAKDRILEIEYVRQQLEGAGLIAASKAILALRTGQTDWLRCLPPLSDATAELSPALRDIARGQMSEISAK
ncbi:MAG: dihydrodipicolinate synthase family protein [Pseudomonadota bacterium]